MRSSFTLFICAILVFTHASCTKDVAAPAGKPGVKGENSTPVSMIFTVDSSAWMINPDLATWKATVVNMLITQEVIENGLVKIYLSRETSWWALPYSEDRDNTTQFGLEAGKIIFLRSDSHGVAARPKKHVFKLVVAETNPQ